MRTMNKDFRIKMTLLLKQKQKRGNTVTDLEIYPDAFLRRNKLSITAAFFF